MHAGKNRATEAAFDARACGVHRQIDHAGEKAIGRLQHEIADEVVDEGSAASAGADAKAEATSARLAVKRREIAPAEDIAAR